MATAAEHSFDPSAADQRSVAHQDPVVRLTGVSKNFEGRLALAPTDLTVEDGEFVALIGPSGCGKTTLLRLVAQLTRPSTGELCYRGGDPEDLARRTAYVFQDATLLPWLRVRENVALPLRLSGASRSEWGPAADRTLSLVGLQRSAHQFPRELSGGMKMRVSIARALICDPSLLLLDEPFGALDEMTRDRLNEELLRLRESAGWTAMFVTHSVSEAVFLASRIIVLAADPGRIHASLAIPLPYPRTAATRATAAFGALVHEVTHALHAVESRSTGGSLEP